MCSYRKNKELVLTIMSYWFWCPGQSFSASSKSRHLSCILLASLSDNSSSRPITISASSDGDVGDGRWGWISESASASITVDSSYCRQSNHESKEFHNNKKTSLGISVLIFAYRPWIYHLRNNGIHLMRIQKNHHRQLTIKRPNDYQNCS